MKTAKIATLYKNGSSLVLAIPAVLCKPLNLKRGDQMVVFTDAKNNIVARKMSTEQYRVLSGR